MGGDWMLTVVIIAMAAVVIILMIGIGGFVRGGAFNKKYGNKMMQLRIAAQFVAICLILLFIWMRSQGAGQ